MSVPILIGVATLIAQSQPAAAPDVAVGGPKEVQELVVTPQPRCLQGERRWQGQVTDQLGYRPLILHIRPDTNGKFAATLDSPFRGALGLQAVGFRLDGQQVEFALPASGGYSTVGDLSNFANALMANAGDRLRPIAVAA